MLYDKKNKHKSYIHSQDIFARVLLAILVKLEIDQDAAAARLAELVRLFLVSEIVF